MPSLNEPPLTRAASLPKASSAAATAYCVMGLVRRSRACARKSGRGEGGGTGLTRSERVRPGRASSLAGSGSSLASASRSGNTPQPAGDTAPMPLMEMFSVEIIAWFTLSPSRNDVFEAGERGRLDRSRRRPADEPAALAPAHQMVSGISRTNCSARRRTERPGRSRSPFPTASFRLSGHGT